MLFCFLQPPNLDNNRFLKTPPGIQNCSVLVIFIPYRSQPIVLCTLLCLMNTTICDNRPWYKIGKLSLYTQKENHSNDLQDRPSSWQVDKGALQRNHNNCVTFFLNLSTRAQKHFVLQELTMPMKNYDWQSSSPLRLAKQQSITIGKVVVHYDWQSSSLYAQKMSETTILIVPIPSSQFCPSYPSVHSQL